MESVVDAVWDLLVGGACAGCGMPGRPWCPVCRSQLRAAGGPPRQAEVVPAPVGLPATWTSCWYDGAVRAALLAFKERGRRELARPLGTLLAASLCHAATHPQTVTVGIPASPSGRRERGYDHVELLVRSAVAHGAPPAAALLRWSRRTEDQVGLGAHARARNRDRALVARPCSGVRVVIVDDIVTTGVTLTEAARALQAAGAEVLGAATVAATRRRARPPVGGRPRDASRD